MLDPQSVRLYIGSAETLRKQRLCFRARISPKGDGRQIRITNVYSDDRPIGWNARSRTAADDTEVDDRGTVGAEDKHVVKGRICVDGVSAPHHELFVEGRVPGEAYSRLKSLVKFVDRREGAGR